MIHWCFTQATTKLEKVGVYGSFFDPAETSQAEIEQPWGFPDSGFWDLEINESSSFAAWVTPYRIILQLLSDHYYDWWPYLYQKQGMTSCNKYWGEIVSFSNNRKPYNACNNMYWHTGCCCYEYPKIPDINDCTCHPNLVFIFTLFLLLCNSPANSFP